MVVHRIVEDAPSSRKLLERSRWLVVVFEIFNWWSDTLTYRLLNATLRWIRLLRDAWWIWCETAFLQNRPHRHYHIVDLLVLHRVHSDLSQSLHENWVTGDSRDCLSLWRNDVEFLGGHSDVWPPVLYPRDREENGLDGVEVWIGHQLLHRLRPHRFSRESVGHGGIGDSVRLGELAISHAEIFEGFFQGVREIYEGIEFRKRGNFSV